MVHKEQSESVRRFNNAVDGILAGLSEDLGPSATLAVVEDDPAGTTWSLEPAAHDAVGLTVDSAGWESLTVTIKDFAVIELGWRAEATPEEVLAELDDICRSVVAGRLTLRVKRRSNAVKYRLVLSDGEALEGSTSWLLPVMPWTEVVEVQPTAYQ